MKNNAKKSPAKQTRARRRTPTLAEARARLKNFRSSWDLLTPAQQEAIEAQLEALDTSVFCGPVNGRVARG